MEKLAGFRKELREAQEGSHPEIEERLIVVKMEKEMAIRSAECFKEYQIQCANSLYETEMISSNEVYEQEKAALKDRMLAEIEERKKKLKEERENFDINNESSLESQKSVTTRKNTRASGRQTEEKKEKKGKKTDKLILSPLKDEEVREDLTQLRKAMKK
ncbi:hypothetical protein HK096_006113 [Nowakowskiella sp. JEL0078]|nr:hypothetical protein HK096_006113 [Nowakowskiella sp. JEL0078]